MTHFTLDTAGSSRRTPRPEEYSRVTNPERFLPLQQGALALLDRLATEYNVVIPFPACGCDACAETAEQEQDRLAELLGHVVAGFFGERLRTPLIGRATVGWSLGDVTRDHVTEGGSSIDRAQARALHRGGPKSIAWDPWPGHR